jgi:hypothetical protein
VRLSRSFVPLIALLAAPLFAHAQVVQLEGGASTLSESSGATVFAYFPNKILEIGAGTVNGTPAIDLAVRQPWHGWDLSLGVEPFGAVVGSTGLFTSVLGVTLSRTSQTSKLVLFAGDVQPLLASTFFHGTPFRLRGGAGAFYKRKVKALTFTSLGVASGKQLTLLGDVDFHCPNFDAGAGGGWLSGKSTLQARSTYHASLGERLNVAASANYLRMDGVTFETVMAAAGYGGLGVYASKILGNRSGETYGASLRLGMFDLGANYLGFKESTSLGTSLGERIGRHLILREFANRSQGRWNESLGGGFTSNRVSVDVNQSVYFTPYGNVPLQRAMTVTMHLVTPWKSSSVNLASGVDPSGKIRYEVGGGMFIGSGIGGPNRVNSFQNTGKFLISGTVVDGDSQPVAGAAIKLGKDLVFSDSTGQFFLRVKRGDRAVPLAVIPEEFTAPGQWVVVSAPKEIVSGTSCNIVVKVGTR